MTYISSSKYAQNNSFKQKRLPIKFPAFRKLKAVLNQIRASQNEPVDIPLNYLGKPVCMWLRTNKYEESCSWNTLLFSCLCIGYGNSHLVESTTAENKRRAFSSPSISNHSNGMPSTVNKTGFISNIHVVFDCL